MNEPKSSTQVLSPGGLPRMPKPAASPGADWLDRLHRFHAGELVGDQAQPVREGMLVPALLAPYRDVGHVRTGYPLVLTGDGGAVQSLADSLASTVQAIAPGADDSRMLKDNLERLELRVGQALGSAAASARATLTQASAQLVADLGLQDASRAKLEQELYCLVDAVPPAATLLPLGADTSLRLLVHAAGNALRERRAAQAARLSELTAAIRRRLDVERSHGAQRRSAQGVAGTTGAMASSFFDPAALAGVVDQRRGTLAMAPERVARLEEALAAVEAFDLQRLPLVTVVHPADLTLPELAGAAFVPAEDPLRAAIERYTEHASSLVDVLRAERMARLELADDYDPARHEAVLARLDWRSMTRDELLLVPTVVAYDRAGAVATRRLYSLVRLLTSGSPVQVLLETEPGLDPLAGVGGSSTLGGARLDLAQLALSLREPVVHQGSVTRPQAMIDGFDLALRTPRPALHLVVASPTGGAGARLGEWFYAEAAVEGRAHPLLRYAPDAGEGLAGRLDCQGNPAPADDWSSDALPCLGSDGREQSLELSFSFADFALLEPGLADHFHAVPVGAEDAELLPLGQWLALGTDEALRHVPWIWAVDADDLLRQVALSRRLAYACRDRVEAWRSLQELAGFKSEYVARAVVYTRQELESAHAAELEALKAAHAAELEAVREGEASEALGRLAAALVDPGQAFLSMGLAAGAAPVAAPKAAAPVAAAPAAAPVEAAPAPAPAEEEELVLGDPWIDSILCTSCNDCLQVNPLMFVYNDQKQAKIGDPSKGTFEQLVRAAEKCPSRCIHPGKPLNPGEANLDALIQRAAAYQ